MKRYIIPFLILTVVSFTGLGFAWWYIQSLSDDITITETVLAGDKKAAEGISVTTTNHHADTPMFWETTYTIGKDGPETITHFSFDKKREDDETVFLEEDGLYLSALRRSFWDDIENWDGSQDYMCLLEDAASQANPGEAYGKTLNLQDYMSCFPADLYGSFFFDEKEVHYSCENMEDYFQFPIPDDYSVRIAFKKQQNNTIKELELDAQPVVFEVKSAVSPNTEDVFVGITGMYLENEKEMYEVEYIPLPLRKESYGVHLFPTAISNDVNSDTYPERKVIAEKGKCIYPLEKGTSILHMDFSKDGKDFLLFTLEEKDVILTVLDGETYAVKQETFICHYESENKPNNPYEGHFVIQDHDSYIFMAAVDGTISLIAKEKDGYRVIFSDTSTIEDLNISLAGISHHNFAESYDGKKLVIALSAQQYSSLPSYCFMGLTSSALIVFEDGILAYAGFYENSLDHSEPYEWGFTYADVLGPLIKLTVPASLEKSEP